MTITAKLKPREDTLTQKNVKDALEVLGEVIELTVEHKVEATLEGDKRDVEWS